MTSITYHDLHRIYTENVNAGKAPIHAMKAVYNVYKDEMNIREARIRIEVYQHSIDTFKTYDFNHTQLGILNDVIEFCETMLTYAKMYTHMYEHITFMCMNLIQIRVKSVGQIAITPVEP